jgi:hypothetical protein
LVAEALNRRAQRPSPPRRFRWTIRAMGARFYLSDKEALYAALDEKSE